MSSLAYLAHTVAIFHRLLRAERGEHADDDDQVLFEEFPEAVPRLWFVDVHAPPGGVTGVTVVGLAEGPLWGRKRTKALRPEGGLSQCPPRASGGCALIRELAIQQSVRELEPAARVVLVNVLQRIPHAA